MVCPRPEKKFKITVMAILVLIVILLGQKCHAKDLYENSTILNTHYHHYPTNVPLSLNLTPNTNETVNLEELKEIDRKYASCGNVTDIRERTIRQFHHFFATKQLSVFQLCACYIRRIKKMNPFLNAVIEINPDALKDALKLDYDRIMGHRGIHGTLYGIPILIKDNIAIANSSMQTCSGSLALVGCKPYQTAPIVTQIKKNRGIILGKSNLSEFANFRSSDIPNGWSGRGGQTHDCYSRAKDPEGSSTGSAVATAANLCAFAIGTETDGSIVGPAERASLVGLKTSRGKIPINGIIPISADTQDVAGPLTRTVEDAAIFMKIFEGYGCKSQHDQDFHHQEKPKFRVGILRQYFWESKNDSQIKTLEILNQTLINFGNSERIILIDPVIAPEGAREAATIDKEKTIFLHEFKDGLNKYLKTCSFQNDSDYGDPNHHNNEYSHMTLKDVIRYNKKNPGPKDYNQTTLIKSEATDGINNITYLNTRNENVNAAQHLLTSIMENNNLDVIAAPICDEVNATSLFQYSAMAGYPYIVVPAGFKNTYEPVGMVFHGLMCSEQTLIEIAKIYEAEIRGRRPPFFAP